MFGMIIRICISFGTINRDCEIIGGKILDDKITDY